MEKKLLFQFLQKVLSQISIFNSRNTHQSCIPALRKPGLPDMIPLGTTLNGSFVWNLGHWDLFEIWSLECEILIVRFATDI